MIQALAACAGAALTIAACWGAGALVLAWLKLKLARLEWLALSFLIGAACLHLALFGVLALRISYWPVVVTILVLAIALGVTKGSRPILDSGSPEPALLPRSGIVKSIAYLIFAAFGLMYFLHALAPEASPDGSGYHLGLVARYLHVHGFERITGNMYSGLGQGVEVLFLAAYAIGRNSAAALVHFGFALVLVVAMIAYGRRIGKPWAGIAGALLVFVSPVVGIDASSAYNDVALAAVCFGVFYALQIWDENRGSKALIAVGLLAGYSYSIKYTAFVMLPFALGYVLWRTRKLAPLLIVSSFGFLMIAPWMLKDWIVFRNPVYPFANQVFRNPNRHVLSEQQYSAYYRNYDLPSLAALPLEVTLRGEKTQGVLGPIFLAAPLALLALRYRAGRRLLAAGAVVFSTYFLNVGTRFLIPVLPFLSLSMALALGDSAALLATVMVFQAFTSWPSNLPFYASQNAWRLQGAQLKAALRKLPADRYLLDHDPGYGPARLLDLHVPAGEHVLSYVSLAEAYTSRNVLSTYQSASSETLADVLNSGWIADYQPRVLHTFKFPEVRSRRIRVTQVVTGGPERQWSVHEIRFFHAGVELPRQPEWRLEAWPNPWEVQLAFDNSPATRWRSWETLSPGMYIQVDFGKPGQVDEVRLETSVDSSDAREQVELIDNSGNQVALVGNPEVTSITPAPWIRRAATFEMASRGIHYLLIGNGDPTAADIREDPEGWGLKQVASEYGVRLYRTNP